METSDFDFKKLYTIFESSITTKIDKKKYNQFLVAYSGGSDSTALLYFANKMAKKYKVEIRAIHVNHNLHADSVDWENHCKYFCKKLNIPIIIKSINIVLKPGESIEERAREERYRVISSYANSKTIMMTAHHANDQSETFLYQLLRGSGVKGLSAMPDFKKISNGYHSRPFLNISKNTLMELVDFKELKYIIDNSNNNTKFSRNYIRKEILPKIKERWPSYSSTISRAANNVADAEKLNRDLAEIDIQNFLLSDDNKISTSVKNLDDYRFNNVIRFWIKKNNFRMPSLEQIYSIYLNVLNAGNDKTPFFSCSEYEIRRHNDYIEIMKPLKKHDSSKIYNWKFEENLVISNLSVNLSWKNLEERLGYNLNKDVEVKFREGGKSIELSKNKNLKDYMRENKIPPWKRDRTLLIYIDKELKIIWD
ncbi:tRNA lysidine(34) synthetase TilS [Gammaproteobacteria bacterium]|nr:tRNA lysidine(34) synthetase TilS [Gammaproteobacteria bacterium]